MDTLVLHETRQWALQVLLKVFAQEIGIEVTTEGSTHEFDRDSSLDALILSPSLAYALYGGKGITNEYHVDNHLGRPILVTEPQIIDTSLSPTPQAQTPISWVVTYPGFKTRIRRETGNAVDQPSIAMAPEDTTLTRGDMIYLEFVCVFETIAEANASGLKPQIRRVGVSTQRTFVNSNAEDLFTAMLQVRKAYQTYRNKYAGDSL